MFDVNKIRKDFPMLNNIQSMQGKNFVYFDSAATSLKPQQVLDEIMLYYTKENANSHRGDYDIAHKVDVKVDQTRENVAKFINANSKEIIFTSGATMGLNFVAYGYCEKFLKEGDELLICIEEHASNVLPWFEICKKTHANLKYFDLDKDGRITLENVKKAITDKTKFISIAHISNVLGYEAPIKEITKFAHEKGIIVNVDAAQSIAHKKVDVKDLDCDFLSFSAHKMCGPTGIGVLYGKYELLCKMDSYLVGGGNNITFGKDCQVDYLLPPQKFEAGTLNLAGIYGLNGAINYLNSLGMDNIEKYEKDLKDYAISKMKENKNLIIYNEFAESAIITFNYKGVFAQDEGTYLNSQGICVRSGQHCAKMLNEFIQSEATVRVSLFFYNTKEEVDQLVKALENGGNFLDAYFN